MSKKLKAETSRALRGIRILVGRARHQAGALSVELRKLGAKVIEIPFIEIRHPRSFRPLDNALNNLNTYDWLILTSANGVEAMWARMEKLRLVQPWVQPWKSGPSGPRLHANRDGALAPALRIAAIGPATEKAIEKHGVKVDVVPREYVAESVVRSLKRKVKGKRVLLVRAKIARDVIPRELRKVGAQVDVVEAYETVVPANSHRRLEATLKNPNRRPHVLTFTSSSTVKNFVKLSGAPPPKKLRAKLAGILMASIGPVTSSTLGELGLKVDIEAKQFTISGLVAAIQKALVE
jgi:uroporphyrinogen-III synthase